MNKRIPTSSHHHRRQDYDHDDDHHHWCRQFHWWTSAEIIMFGYILTTHNFFLINRGDGSTTVKKWLPNGEKSLKSREECLWIVLPKPWALNSTLTVVSFAFYFIDTPTEENKLCRWVVLNHVLPMHPFNSNIMKRAGSS